MNLLISTAAAGIAASIAAVIVAVAAPRGGQDDLNGADQR